MIIKNTNSIEEEGSRTSINGGYSLGLDVDEESRKPETRSTEDVRCGISCFHPKWLQTLASKKTYVLVYALAGMVQFIMGAYNGGTLTTIEKRFNMSSRMNGILSSAYDIGNLIGMSTFTYFASKGHRTRWIGFGMFLAGIASFIRNIPHILFGPGETVKMYTKEYAEYYNFTGNLTDLKQMSTNVNCEITSTNEDSIAFYCFMVSNIIVGLGTATYWTCGGTYLDDNVRKNIVPTLLAVVQTIRLFGPTVGYYLASYALTLYVDPNLTPLITNSDPRWIGAWWLGWYPIGVGCFLVGGLIYFFPRTLPRAALRRRNIPQANVVSFKDFKRSMKRILTNKILMYNSFSTVFFVIGLLGYYTFMPKYLESQFRLTASQSNFITGTVGILSNALGILTSGLVITYFKPSPRYLAGWNVLTEILEVIGYTFFAWTSCPEQEYHGHWNADQSWNLTEPCNIPHKCGTDIQFAPVCDSNTGLAYYSYCFAGCTSSYTINNTSVYTNCSCVPGVGSVVQGFCKTDCSKYIIIFTVLLAVLSYFSACGRAGSTLIQFRCVKEEDKTLSIGVLEIFLSVLVFIPFPAIYGALIDRACKVWADNCGTPGNCWIYDAKGLSVFNFAAPACLFIGTILDAFVWYYVKGLDIYDEDFEKSDDDQETKSRKNSTTNNMMLILSNPEDFEKSDDNQETKSRKNSTTNNMMLILSNPS